MIGLVGSVVRLAGRDRQKLSTEEQSIVEREAKAATQSLGDETA